MLQKSSRVIPIDSNGIFITEIFHLYWGFKKKIILCGGFFKSSAKQVKKKNKIGKKTKTKGILFYTKIGLKRYDNSILS
jgi:hypothetical protein